MNIILSLLEKNTDKREQRTLLREAGELFGQMDFLLASLLKLSRLDAGIVIFKKEQVDISNLISVSLRPFLISMELHNIQIQTDIPHLFERFYRGKDADAAGYGIGLALCRTVIMRQGGTVTAKNHPQGGAVFYVRFLK